jgi:DNA-binding response OmpR family regulator
LAERVWEAHHDMETNLIEVYVRKLRQKLESTPDAPVIKTLRGVGYSLE